MSEITTVGEDFPKQQARVREVLGLYRDIGPNGMFGAMMIEKTLQEADEAQASGNIIEILRSYEALKEIEA